MGYGIFKSKEEYDAWMQSYAEVQNQLNGLQRRVSIKQVELAAEETSDFVSEAQDLISDISQNDDDHRAMMSKALQTIVHTVSLLEILIKSFGGSR